MRGLSLILCVFVVTSTFAERQPLERYQTIVDRQMFGPPPAGFDPTKMPSEVAKTKGKGDQELTKEQEQIKNAIKFSVLNVTSEGETVVGFSDNGDPKNPLHYYLKVGETSSDSRAWTVKEADKDAATMTIANKEGIEVTLKLGGDSATDAGAVSRTDASNAATKNGSGRNSLLGSSQSLRSRRMQERQQMQEDAAKREAEDKARAVREAEEKAQREAEREEQHKQLMQIQEELRKAREARENNAAKESGKETPSEE